MKLSNFKFFISIIFCSFLLAGCGNSNPEEKVVIDYYTAIANGKTDDALALIDFSTAKPNEIGIIKEKLRAFMDEMKERTFDSKGGLKSIEITNKEFSDDKKTVNISYIIHFNDGSQKADNITLVNIDGKWKIRVK